MMEFIIEEMKVVIDCDDAAIELKEVIVAHLQKSGVEAVDLDYLGQHPWAFYPEIGYNLALKIQDGTFASEFVQEFSTGRKVHFLAKRRMEAEHQLEQVGKELRGMMSWLEEDKKKYE